MQEIRTYYKFLDVDVDRYHIDGSYQQVTLAARELAPSLLSANAQTWVNLHLLFTHGNGVVMSPVTQKSAEGLPIFYLKDIPPVASGGPPITEPRIYFGEGAEDYVIVKSSTPEFDYPKGKDNVYTTYDGKDGIPIGGTSWRTLFAWYFNDVNILLSSYITGESRILLHRNIQDRVRTIAPFLRLDHDLYVVISDGRLYWIQDAYATSSWFPTPSRNPVERPTTFATRSRRSSTPITGRSRFMWKMRPIRLSQPTGKSSRRCSSRSMPCRRIYKNISAIPRIYLHPGSRVPRIPYGRA